jgi:hypothetical protein
MSYDLSNFGRRMPWVVTEGGFAMMFTDKGEQINCIKSVRVGFDKDNYATATVEVVVNVGTRQEMEAMITQNEEINGLSHAEAQVLIDRLRKAGYFSQEPEKSHP